MIKPFKIEIVDPDGDTTINDLWNVIVELDIETSELHAYMLSETPEFDKEVKIRVKE